MKFMTFDAEQQKQFDEWVATRPPVIQEMIAKLPPDRLYFNKKSGKRVTIISYEEDGTVTVFVSGKYNQCVFERNVFGIPAEDLVECDLPGEGEPVGAALTEPAEIDEFIEKHRAEILRQGT